MPTGIREGSAAFRILERILRDLQFENLVMNQKYEGSILLERVIEMSLRLKGALIFPFIHNLYTLIFPFIHNLFFLPN